MLNELLERRYYCADDMEEREISHCCCSGPGKYGFIALKNPDFRKEKVDKFGNTYIDEMAYLFRKPNPKERREIVLNTIIEGSGRAFSVHKLAKYLAVTDRTIQTLLRSLEREGLIRPAPRYADNGARLSNRYRYVGEPCKFYGSGLNLHHLYDPEKDVGFRRWPWGYLSFPHDKVWYDFYGECKLKFSIRTARGEYLRERGLPLVVPEEVNFLVLRYCYWKGKSEILYTCDPEHPERDRQFSTDGTIKAALAGEKVQKVKFYDKTFELHIVGSRENPEVEIWEQGELIAVFSWFTENILERTADVDETHSEQFFILGDFTAR